MMFCMWQTSKVFLFYYVFIIHVSLKRGLKTIKLQAIL